MSDAIKALEALRDAAFECGSPSMAKVAAVALALLRAKQPAPAEVPPMPEVWDKHDRGPGSFCHAHDVRALHAAAVALAERCERAEADFAAAMREVTAARRAQGEAEGKLAASEMAGVVEGWKERCEQAEAQLAEAQAERNRIADLLSDADARHTLALREARRQERERCAKVCDGIVAKFGASSPVTADECRDAIRALPEED